MTQGWGHNPPEDPDHGMDDATRMFPPVTPGSAPSGPDREFTDNPFRQAGAGQSGAGQAGAGQWDQQIPYQDPGRQDGGPVTGGAPWYGGPVPVTGAEGQKSRGPWIVVAVLVVLLLAAVGTILAMRWDSLFGSGGSGQSDGTAVTTVVVPPPGESGGAQDPGSGGGQGRGTDDSSTAGGSGARPTRPSLPSGVTAVNAAALSGAPTGDFNSIWKSGPTTDDFALAVRDAYVQAYLADRDTDQTVNAYSPTTQLTYTMTCTDTGSYVHCTGGNNANVYIA